MDPHLREILDLLVRWVHFIAGIMWIGNSMLFNWLDRNLEKPADAEPGYEGTMWMVHSGGFYEVEKKQLQPHQLPATLHWFKWQNGVTWLSGILLLIIVYYLGGAAYMVDPSIAAIGLWQAIGIGIGSVVVSWLVYDAIWRSPLGKQTPVAFTLCFVYVAAVCYGLCQVLPGRAAYIHVGVLLGTLMTANVWMYILPSQRALVASTKAGQPQDAALGWRAKQRSIHNNYMTFPLLFIMISNHFPSTYGNTLNWLILIALALSSAGVRHFMNIRFTYAGWLPPLLLTAAVGVAALWFLTARPAPAPVPAGVAAPSFSEAQAVVTQRCVTCHSAHPSDATFATAPAGVRFDTPAEIKAHADRIKALAVDSTAMPLGNKTGMTQAERDLLGRWVAAGAPID